MNSTTTYYAALIDYGLQDMRVASGPYKSLRGARNRCSTLTKYVHEPFYDTKVGDWFAVHDVASPRHECVWSKKNPKNTGWMSTVMGPSKTKKEANQDRTRNHKDVTIAPDDKGFVAQVVAIVGRHKNGKATHVVLERK